MDDLSKKRLEKEMALRLGTVSREVVKAATKILHDAGYEECPDCLDKRVLGLDAVCTDCAELPGWRKKAVQQPTGDNGEVA